MPTRYALAALVLLGCGSGTALSGSSPPGGDADRTGLEGVALRGPIQPVCQTGVSCDEPFSGTFEARQSTQVVARFESDPAGHFLVYLPPGTYTIAPEASTPSVTPGQTREVLVGVAGLTHMDLQFDTGIR